MDRTGSFLGSSIRKEINMGKLKGKKTYILGGLGLLTAIASYLVGDATAAEAGQAALTSVLAMTLRNSIS